MEIERHFVCITCEIHNCELYAGNILDNHDLISTLESAKSKSIEIADKLEHSKITAAEIEDVRVRYTPAAKRGAILFFVMASLANITNMYEYSLDSFLRVFNQSLDTSKRDASLKVRLRNIIERNTLDVYSYTCLGNFTLILQNTAPEILYESLKYLETRDNFFAIPESR